MRLKTAFLVFVIVVWARGGGAQQSDGDLEGRVLDSNGKPLQYTNVVLQGPNLQGARNTLTDRLGYFHVVALPVGQYTVRFTHIAHHDASYENVLVQLGKTTSLGEVRLERREFVGETVIVYGEKPALDPTSTALQTNLQSKLLQALPTDRNFRSIVNLVPQANANFPGESGSNIGGGTTEETYYYIDGVDATDPGTAGTSTNLPYNFVQEIEVKTGGYEAEYGHASGGIVNVITPSGGNVFRGQVFGFFTNRRLVGTSRASILEPGQGGFSSYDFGGSIGGPIVRDKLWFHGAYNPTFDNRHADVAGIPRQDLDKTVHRFAGKLTWQPGSRTNLVFTALGDPGHEHRLDVYFAPTLVQNADCCLTDDKNGGVSLSLKATRELRSNVLLKTSISHVHNKSWSLPVGERWQTEPLTVDYRNGVVVSGGRPGIQKNHQDRTAGDLSGTIFLGTHTVKTGFEYVDNSITNDYRAGLDKGAKGFLFIYGDSVFSTFQQFQLGTTHMRLPAAYAQDSWLIHKRLRLNGGLRWDGQYLVAATGKTALRITNGWQPRLGLVYQPGELGSQKIFGSAGRFYEQTPAWSPGYYFFDSEQLTVNYDHDPRIDPSGGDSTKLLPNPPGIGKLKGQYFDEFVLGYEREMPHHLRVGLRGIYRTLRWAIDDSYSNDAGIFLLGNPGRESLSYLPRAKRNYSALEITAERFLGQRGNLLASYVLSRKYGNYSGLDYGNAGPQFDNVEGTVHATGLLPYDRTHVLKLSGSYGFDFGLTAGTSWILESGTPLNDLGATRTLNYVPAFLQKRGSVGRTPTIWDWNIRLSYDRVAWPGSSARPKLILDLFHLFSQRRALRLDEQHYFGLDPQGQQADPNPRYLKPILFQPPFSARLGLLVDY